MAKNIWSEFDKVYNTEELAKELKDIEESNGTGNYQEVPDGTYEVKIEKLEPGKTKNGNPKLSAWCRILDGEFKNAMKFVTIPMRHSFQIHKACEFLRGLISDTDIAIDVEYKTFERFADLILDIHEAIDGKYEYAIEFATEKGYPKYTVTETFELE